MPEPALRRTLRTVSRTLTVLVLLYLFLTAIGLMDAGLKLYGKGFARQLIATTSNPIVGLFVGILITSVIQSSSVTTSLVVAAVAGETIPISCAVPIVMGANIGTTVTSLLVSFGCVTRREEFRRALGCATVHDFFNLLTVILLLPTELLVRAVTSAPGRSGVGFLEYAGTKLAGIFSGAGQIGKFNSPIKAACKPLVILIENALTSLTGAVFGERSGAGASSPIAATLIVLVAGGLILWTLFTIVRVLRKASADRLGVIFDRFVGNGGLVGLLLGLGITIAVQSSSMTLSLCVPMAAAGIVTIDQIFSVTLGANLGTTVTGILAALGTGSVAGLAIALVHTLFNLTGILIFFPFRPMRAIPIGLARWFSGVASESRWIAVLYLTAMFFVLPLLCVLIGRLL
ncbi:MAG: Na/Pi symporter [Verrucomicrobia bacterium]|nr:Na/Pi symporter [Verrucomicrobiota bacterium]